MFGFIIRIISVFFIIVFFSILVFSSFLQDESDTTLYNIQNTLSYSGGFLGNSGSILGQEEVSLFETLFAASGSFPYEKKDQEFILDISQSGSYISSLRDITKKYTFTGTRFNILQKGVGEVYFDIERTPDKVFIFPLNTSLEIELLGGENQDVYTRIFLIPHMYVEIDLTKINSLKNADALRVQNLFRLGYIPTDISQTEAYPILQNYGIVENSFFFTALASLKQRDLHFQKYLQFLQQQEVLQTVGYESIARYGNIFINSEKKVAFYKNIILQSYIKILQEQKYTKEDIENIRRDLTSLSLLDEQAYKTMLDIQTHIRAFLFSSGEKQHILPKLSFSFLADENSLQTQGFFYVYSHSFFTLYDTQAQYAGDLLRRFLQSFISYFPLRETEDGTSPNFQYEYFLFFLKHQLTFLLNYDTQENQMEAIVSSLKNYIDISENSIDTASPTARITSLYIYDEILKDIEIFLRTQYFASERTERNLLVLSENRIGSRPLTVLKTEVGRIFKIYTTFEKTLDLNDTRDASISKNISSSISQIEEYFLALENYQSYTSQYDIAIKNLLTIGTPLSETFELNIQTAQNFLSTFIGLDISTLQIELKEGYYHIENVYISGKVFNFDLYPYTSYYKMKNIMIDGKLQNFVYNLYIPEPSVDQTEKQKSDFFIRTFFASSYSEEEQDLVVEEESLNEDKRIIVFKREKLLGEKGDFYPLRTLLPIKYEDIEVQKTATGYSIFIDTASINASNLSGYAVFFTTEYVLTQTEKFFKDLNITLSNSEEQVSIFGSHTLTVVGKLPLGNTANIIESLINILPNIVELYGHIEKKYKPSTLSMQYVPSTKKVTFKFDSLGKKYTISLAGAQVEKIYVGTTNTLQTPINLSDIGKYLP